MFKYFIRYSYQYSQQYKRPWDDSSGDYITEEISSTILVSDNEFYDIFEVHEELKKSLNDTSNTYYDIIAMNRL